jgi:hypothetical protein
MNAEFGGRPSKGVSTGRGRDRRQREAESLEDKRIGKNVAKYAPQPPMRYPTHDTPTTPTARILITNQKQKKHPFPHRSRDQGATTTSGMHRRDPSPALFLSVTRGQPTGYEDGNAAARLLSFFSAEASSSWYAMALTISPCAPIRYMMLEWSMT